MNSPWGQIAAPVESLNLADIMSEEYAHRVQDNELKKYERQFEAAARREREQAAALKATTEHDLWETLPECTFRQPLGNLGLISYSEAAKLTDDAKWPDCSNLLKQETAPAAEASEELPPEVLYMLRQEESVSGCDSDEVIALMMQSQYDREYNSELRRIEEKRNKQSKVSISLDKYMCHGDLEFLNDPVDYDDDEGERESQRRAWDRFETNEKILDAIPKCGFMVDKEGEMITKHDEELCGVRNACRVMSFPPEFPTGDGAGFEMKLSNQVFNQLRNYSRRGVNGSSSKKSKMHDRKENAATAEMGVDAATRLLLYKLINNQILQQINGIISVGKEAVILHANSDPSKLNKEHPDGIGAFIPTHLLPKECAIKIFKTTLNEFKQRDRYIKDDYRFKDRFSKQNNRVIINMWAEKEMHNMMRMQSAGINCPDVVVLKRHVLVMSFIGDNNNAAPKLKNANLNDAELSSAYEEIVQMMHKLYNEAKLVHADLSEYNILWYEGKCWFIDVAQSVAPEHPSALEFLMRDCGNIIKFFTRQGLPNIYTKEQLFEHITALNAEVHNVAMLERIHTRGASHREATAPNQEQCPAELRPISYPFDLAWEKSLADKQRQKEEEMQVSSGMCDAAQTQRGQRASNAVSFTAAATNN